jgi:hypothetical protein
MNKQLRRMMVDAEGRYLSENELDQLRTYAASMGERLEAARRLEQAEARIVADAVDGFAARHPDYFRTTPEAREKTTRDFTLTLRYAATAHVREDAEFFRTNFAAWIGTLLRDLVSPQILIDGQEQLRDSLDRHLDAADARCFRRYLNIYIEELGR